MLPLAGPTLQEWRSSIERRIMQDTGLFYRLIILVLVLALIAMVDWWRHPEHPTKWREYLFLLSAGLLGGLFGAATDQVTSTISPEYFVLGKGIAEGEAFRLDVTRLGFHAGFLAGAIIGGVFLMANNPKAELSPLSYRTLAKSVPWPIVAALAVAPITAILAWLWDPLDYAAQLAGLLPAARMSRFLAVWGIHLGLYAGGLAGTIGGVVWIGWRRRRTVES